MALLGLVAAASAAAEQPPAPDLIVHHGKIVTVDPDFRIVEAMAVRGDRILAVGENAKMLELAGPQTRQIDLGGKTVLPGLIDSHLHIVSDPPCTNSTTRCPRWKRSPTCCGSSGSGRPSVRPGEWIELSQVFITRLREQRYPTRAELDEAAPHNPAVFSTGPDAVLNSMALKLCGIDKTFRITDGQPGRIERDEASGEPTGVLRRCSRLLKYRSAGKNPTAEDQVRRVKQLLAAYNEVGPDECHGPRHVRCARSR